MNIKNTKLFITTFALILFAGALFFSPSVTYAQNIVVAFENNPLFNEVNFLPGNEVVRTVEVANRTEESQSVIVEAVNSIDDGGLGDFLALKIMNGATILYDGTLGNFLRVGEVPLSDLGPNSSTVYSFGVTFDGNADNDTQEAGLGFDLCVGFEGGESHCGGTVVGGEGGTGGGGASGGGGGGIIHLTPLEVFNEDAKDTDEESVTALIEWESNILSTSQVIYGKESDGPYSLNLTVAPYFGYPFGTVEDPIKVINHSVLLTDLEPGETYVYRVVSRASPPTVGFQYKFALTKGGDVTDVAVDKENTKEDTSGVVQISGGAIRGSADNVEGEDKTNDSSTKEDITKVAEEDGGVTLDNSQVAAIGLIAFPDNIVDLFKCLGAFLLFVLLIYIAWILFNIRKGEYSAKELKKKRNSFFFIGLVISIGAAYLLGMGCTIIPLSILALIFLLLYITDKLTK